MRACRSSEILRYQLHSLSSFTTSRREDNLPKYASVRRPAACSLPVNYGDCESDQWHPGKRSSGTQGEEGKDKKVLHPKESHEASVDQGGQADRCFQGRQVSEPLVTGGTLPGSPHVGSSSRQAEEHAGAQSDLVTSSAEFKLPEKQRGSPDSNIGSAVTAVYSFFGLPSPRIPSSPQPHASHAAQPAVGDSQALQQDGSRRGRHVQAGGLGSAKFFLSVDGGEAPFRPVEHDAHSNEGLTGIGIMLTASCTKWRGELRRTISISQVGSAWASACGNVARFGRVLLKYMC